MDGWILVIPAIIAFAFRSFLLKFIMKWKLYKTFVLIFAQPTYLGSSVIGTGRSEDSLLLVLMSLPLNLNIPHMIYITHFGVFSSDWICMKYILVFCKGLLSNNQEMLWSIPNFQFDSFGDTWNPTIPIANEIGSVTHF